jgi:hypothetical protein
MTIELLNLEPFYGLIIKEFLNWLELWETQELKKLVYISMLKPDRKLKPEIFWLLCMPILTLV